MLQQDYLMRMFTALAIAMRESMLRAQGDEDPEGAAELLEAALDKTTDITPEELDRFFEEQNVDPSDVPDPSSLA